MVEIVFQTQHVKPGRRRKEKKKRKEEEKKRKDEKKKIKEKKKKIEKRKPQLIITSPTSHPNTPTPQHTLNTRKEEDKVCCVPDAVLVVELEDPALDPARVALAVVQVQVQAVHLLFQTYLDEVK